MAPQVNRSMRLPESEFFPPNHTKSGIAIHHTVGGTAASTFEWWMRDKLNGGRKRTVGTAYIIGRDGTIYEIFDPAGWAYQFGLDWPPARRIRFEKRFIGIELASEGGLLASGGKLYSFDRISPKTEKPSDEAWDYGSNYRGYRYFDKYEEAQIDGLVSLVDHLCDRFTIPRQMPRAFSHYYGDRLFKFTGIIGHAMVRADKTDPAPFRSMWDRITKECRVLPRTVQRPRRVGRPGMSREEIEALFQQNMEQIDLMYVPAGSMVKGLIMELERRDTYIELHDAIPGEHVVMYRFRQGVKRLVKSIGGALGFRRVSDSLLEVPNV